MNQPSRHSNRSTAEERQTNLNFIRTVYILVAITLTIALIWSSFCLYWWSQLGAPIVDWWYFGVVAAALVVLLIFIAVLIDAVKRFPINWIIYVLFTLSFAHLAAFLDCLESKRCLYFGLWVLTAIAVAFAIYTFCVESYLHTTEAFVLAFGASSLVLVAFIVFSHLSFFYLILVYLPTSIFGMYMGYNLRSTVRHNLFLHEQDDPVSEAVRIWFESCLVFCRVGELFGNSMINSKCTECV